MNHKGLDYAVVGVSATGLNGEPLSQFQFLPLIAAKGKILKGDPVNIIQHPEGRPKQYATVNNHLLDLRDDGFLLYTTDTLEAQAAPRSLISTGKPSAFTIAVCHSLRRASS